MNRGLEAFSLKGAILSGLRRSQCDLRRWPMAMHLSST
jgi:hypothetical protein